MKKPANKAAPVASAPAQYTIKTLEQVRILAHPLRLRLFEAFASGPTTTRQVARAFGVPATRLYHHVNALEGVGLIRLRETRPVRGTIEKYYEAVARRMVVDAGLFSDVGKSRRKDELRAGLDDVLSSVLEEARRDVTESMGRVRSTPEGLRPVALRAIVTATPAQLVVLRAKLLRMLKQPLGPKASSKKSDADAKARITLFFAAETSQEAAGTGKKRSRKPKAGKQLA